MNTAGIVDLVLNAVTAGVRLSGRHKGKANVPQTKLAMRGSDGLATSKGLRQVGVGTCLLILGAKNDSCEHLLPSRLDETASRKLKHQ